MYTVFFISSKMEYLQNWLKILLKFLYYGFKFLVKYYLMFL